MTTWSDLLVRKDVEVQADLHDEPGKFDVVQWTKGLA